jgi:hypothetical protein
MFPAGTRAETFELDLGERETAMLRGYWERIRLLESGAERTALINEVRVQMDMIALFDAEIEDEPESQLVAVAAAEKEGSDAEGQPAAPF